jgi:hypothetical protein
MPDGGRLLIETADETIGDESAGAIQGAVPGQYVCWRWPTPASA